MHRVKDELICRNIKTLLNYVGTFKHANKIIDEYITRNANDIVIRTARITQTFFTTNSYVTAKYLYQKIPHSLREDTLLPHSNFKTNIKNGCRSREDWTGQGKLRQSIKITTLHYILFDCRWWSLEIGSAKVLLTVCCTCVFF